MPKAKPKRTLAPPLVALAIFLPVLAACGESDDSSGGSGAAPAAAAPSGGAAGKDNDQFVKFAQCMRQNGVPQWPDAVAGKFRIRRGSVDPNSPQFKAAAQACTSSWPLVTSALSSSLADIVQSTRRQPTRRKSALGEGDGVIPHGVAVSVFDEERPAVGKLDPDLLAALRRAATDAKADGVRFRVNSGWRSPEYQQRLLQDAVVKYGSRKKAARWVSTPETSAHVKGEAVDTGPSGAAAWLSRHGAAYGLCQIYRNEPWHYELRPDAVDDGCPPMYANPAEDPRMRP
jgi:zinc D-Ala-D-Ala carboxypeptidase